MNDVPQYWLLFVFAFPVLHTYYYAFLGTFLDPEESELTYWTYALFAFAGGGAVFLFAPIEFDVGFRPVYLLLPLGGMALYAVETYLWYHYTGKPIEVASSPIESMIPVPFVSIPEEVVFRVGALPLVGLLGAPVYAVVSGVLFGLYHYSFGMRDVLFKSVDGMLYAGVFLATGSLLAPILLHTGYNLASMYIIADYRHVPYLNRIAPGQ